MLSFVDRFLLFPYWAALKLRNFLYDCNIKKSVSFSNPVICIGNITVGGTGKTPFTELLIRKLCSDNFVRKHGKINLSILSRGYKRKTKGFRLVNVGENYKMVGDEPLQMKNKFPSVRVAVCEKRKVGIAKLLEMGSDGAGKDVIVLDDAFQHRQVNPSCSIVLMNFNRPIFSDHLLPFGRLRDLPEQIKRADKVVITNSPFYYGDDEYANSLVEDEFLQRYENVWRANLKLRDNQQLYFTAINYCEAQPVFKELGDTRYIYSKSAVYFSGIANDNKFRDYITDIYKLNDSISFKDHCSFNKSDISKIEKLSKKYPLSIILTTEKDSVRLVSNPYLGPEIKKRLFYVPIELKIIGMENDERLCTGLL